jgi:hypothetical protein
MEALYQSNSALSNLVHHFEVTEVGFVCVVYSLTIVNSINASFAFDCRFNCLQI